jgi:hypothetical protein
MFVILPGKRKSLNYGLESKHVTLLIGRLSEYNFSCSFRVFIALFNDALPSAGVIASNDKFYSCLIFQVTFPIKTLTI